MEVIADILGKPWRFCDKDVVRAKIQHFRARHSATAQSDSGAYRLSGGPPSGMTNRQPRKSAR
jgi:hypothetical protein